jgi:drug/metabolite transporter (DMT)-like permease
VTFAALGSHRRPRPRELLGLALGMLGVAVFVGAGGLGEVQAGDVLSLAGAISFGAYAAMIERRGGRVPQRELVATSLTAGTIVLIIGSIPAMLDQDWGLVRAADWLLVLYAATGPILLGFALWAWALQRRGMARTAPFGYLSPSSHRCSRSSFSVRPSRPGSCSGACSS